VKDVEPLPIQTRDKINIDEVFKNKMRNHKEIEEIKRTFSSKFLALKIVVEDM